MGNTDSNVDEKSNVKSQFVKMMLGVAAGFIATKVVESAFDKVVEHRQNETKSEG